MAITHNRYIVIIQQARQSPRAFWRSSSVQKHKHESTDERARIDLAAADREVVSGRVEARRVEASRVEVVR